MFGFLKRREDLKKYNNILRYAHSLIDEANVIIEDHPILDVVRLLGRPLQTHNLTQILFKDRVELGKVPRVCPENFILGFYEKVTVKGMRFCDLVERKEDSDKEVILGRDLILPWPWSRERSINSIVNIGKGRSMGKWQQDVANHRVILWLPMGIAWVDGGNHSIAAGIIKMQGKIKPDYTYDISNIYKYVYCDGKNYIRKEDGKIISSVKNIEFATIFEIGRIMADKSICF